MGFSRNVRGNALIEYGVIGAVILVGALAVLIGTGGQLNDWLRGLQANMQQSSAAATAERERQQALAAQRAAEQQQGQQPPGNDNNPGNGNTAALPEPGGDPGNNPALPGAGCFQNGRMCINIPTVDATTTTSGSNGVELTHEFASVLDAIAQQLANDPNADPSLVELISQLANQGHTQANAQEAADGMSLYSGQVQGKITEVQNANSTFQSYYSDLSAYLSANPSALDDRLKSLISLEVSQINAIAGAYTTENMTQNTEYVQPDGSVAQGPPKSSFSIDNAQLVHQDANTICGTGGRNCMQGG